jgi:hypothetical protein
MSPKEETSCDNGTQESEKETKPDFISIFGNLVKEYTNKINIDEECLEAYTRDVKNACNLLGSVFLQKSPSMLETTAEELRKKTVNDLYNPIKIGVLTNGIVGQYEYSTPCHNKTILAELKNKLESEGYMCEMTPNQKGTCIVVKW